MENALSLFEEYTQRLADTLAPNLTYEQRCQQRNVQQEIIDQCSQMQTIIAQLKNKSNSIQMLQQKEHTFIQEHHQLTITSLKEIVPLKLTSPQLQFQKKVVSINHKIKITIRITEINLFMRQWGNIENELPFQRFRVHLHHVDKQASSQYITYHPCIGMQHISGSVDNKHIKNNPEITLSLQHVIRSHNYLLYNQLFQKESVTLVAERNDGCVIAIAEIDMSLFSQLEAATRVPRCVKFVRRFQTQQNLTQEPVFFAKCFIGMQSTVISPQMNELNQNIQSQINETAKSRSPSPNRIISLGNKPTEKSPKKKRQLVKKLISPQQKRVNLSIYECWEYKYKLKLTDLPYSKELIYKSVLNLKERKVELVKVSEDYYFKLFVVKLDSSKPAQIIFSFNKIEYRVHVLPNNLFQKIPFSDYEVKSKVERKDTEIVYKNCLIDLGKGNFIYARENNRLQKNLNRLQVESGMLGTLFVRSFLDESQIQCSKPFNLVGITKKEDGFMLTYQYLQEIAKEKEQLLVVYLRSKHNNINEINVYDCLILPRKVTRQSLFKELRLHQGQMFTKLSLKMIASDKAIYEIESADNHKVRVVNGSQFEYRATVNEDLVLQVVGCVPLLIDLLFRDNKNRSFFLKLSIKQSQIQKQQ